MDATTVAAYRAALVANINTWQPSLTPLLTYQSSRSAVQLMTHPDSGQRRSDYLNSLGSPSPSESLQKDILATLNTYKGQIEPIDLWLIGRAVTGMLLIPGSTLA